MKRYFVGVLVVLIIGACSDADVTNDPDLSPPNVEAIPAGKSLGKAIDVELRCNDVGFAGCDKIYYTTNKTDPDLQSNVYDPDAKIHIEADTEIRFFATDRSNNKSEITSEEYVFDLPYVVASPPSKISNTNESINLNCDFGASSTASTCTIYYTTNGTPPNIASTQYDGSPIVLSTEGNHVISYITVDNLGKQSEPEQSSYLLDFTAPETEVNIAGNTYNTPLNVNIDCKIENASIPTSTNCTQRFYTLDPNATPNQFIAYTGPVPITQEGTNTLHYYAVDEAGNIEDINSMEYILDFTQPTIIKQEPAPEQILVAAESPIIVQFNEELENIEIQNIVVTDKNGNTIGIGNVGFDNASNTLTVIPNSGLLLNNSYTINFDNIRDIAGNSLSYTAWTFYTIPTSHELFDQSSAEITDFKIVYDSAQSALAMWRVDTGMGAKTMFSTKFGSLWSITRDFEVNAETTIMERSFPDFVANGVSNYQVVWVDGSSLNLLTSRYTNQWLNRRTIESSVSVNSPLIATNGDNYLTVWENQRFKSQEFTLTGNLPIYNFANEFPIDHAMVTNSSGDYGLAYTVRKANGNNEPQLSIYSFDTMTSEYSWSNPITLDNTPTAKVENIKIASSDNGFGAVWTQNPFKPFARIYNDGSLSALKELSGVRRYNIASSGPTYMLSWYDDNLGLRSNLFTNSTGIWETNDTDITIGGINHGLASDGTDYALAYHGSNSEGSGILLRKYNQGWQDPVLISSTSNVRNTNIQLENQSGYVLSWREDSSGFHKWYHATEATGWQKEDVTRLDYSGSVLNHHTAINNAGIKLIIWEQHNLTINHNNKFYFTTFNGTWNEPSEIYLGNEEIAGLATNGTDFALLTQNYQGIYLRIFDGSQWSQKITVPTCPSVCWVTPTTIASNGNNYLITVNYFNNASYTLFSVIYEDGQWKNQQQLSTGNANLTSFIKTYDERYAILWREINAGNTAQTLYYREIYYDSTNSIWVNASTEEIVNVSGIIQKYDFSTKQNLQMVIWRDDTDVVNWATRQGNTWTVNPTPLGNITNNSHFGLTATASGALATWKNVDNLELRSFENQSWTDLETIPLSIKPSPYTITDPLSAASNADKSIIVVSQYDGTKHNLMAYSIQDGVITNTSTLETSDKDVISSKISYSNNQFHATWLQESISERLVYKVHNISF